MEQCWVIVAIRDIVLAQDDNLHFVELKVGQQRDDQVYLRSLWLN